MLIAFRRAKMRLVVLRTVSTIDSDFTRFHLFGGLWSTCLSARPLLPEDCSYSFQLDGTSYVNQMLHFIDDG